MPTGLPFKLESLRPFALWESHMVNGARSMVRRFASIPLRILIGCYESISKSTFPALKPKPNYYQYPQYYMSNNRSVVPDTGGVIFPQGSSSHPQFMYMVAEKRPELCGLVSYFKKLMLRVSESIG